jgi:hypothetical protein
MLEGFSRGFEILNIVSAQKLCPGRYVAIVSMTKDLCS